MKRCTACEDRGCILFVLVSVCVVGKNPNTPNWSSMADDAIAQGSIWLLGSPFYTCGHVLNLLTHVSSITDATVSLVLQGPELCTRNWQRHSNLPHLCPLQLFCLSIRGRGYSTLVSVHVCLQPEGPKMGACRTDWAQIWRLVELTFLTKCCFQNWFLAQIEASELDSDQFLGIETENLPKLDILNWKLRNILWFWLEQGPVELKNVEKGVLWSGWGSTPPSSPIYPCPVPNVIYLLVETSGYHHW